MSPAICARCICYKPPEACFLGPRCRRVRDIANSAQRGQSRIAGNSLGHAGVASALSCISGLLRRFLRVLRRKATILPVILDIVACGSMVG
jgi:hypothetical protein